MGFYFDNGGRSFFVGGLPEGIGGRLFLETPELLINLSLLSLFSFDFLSPLNPTSISSGAKSLS